MSKQEFDPEKVERWDILSSKGPFVLESDYDRLLALYLEAIIALLSSRDNHEIKIPTSILIAALRDAHKRLD